MTLPPLVPPSSAPSPGDRPVPPASPAQICFRYICIDDNDLACDVLARRLGPPRFEFAGSAHGEEDGCSLAAAKRPAVAMVEISPDGGGGDWTMVIRRLKASHPALRVAAYSAELEPESIRRALAAGADGFIHKGEPAATFVEIAARIAAGEHVISPVAMFILGAEGWPEEVGGR